MEFTKNKSFFYILIGLVIGIGIQRYGIIGLLISLFATSSVETSEKQDPKLTEKLIELHLELPQESIDALDLSRELALKYRKGYRTHPDNPEYVSGYLLQNESKNKIKLKQKGGIVGHYNDKNKVSLNIKMKNSAFLGMKKFSISKPSVRKYLNEWVFHRLNHHLGIIAYRFEFVNIFINGENKGIFSIEESVSKQLLENNQRKDAPIISFNPDYLWKQNDGLEIIPLDDVFNSASIKLYNKKHVLNDSTLKTYFQNAKELLIRFRNQKLKTSDVFDVKKMADFIAIIDLFGNDHGLGLWNVKFYYNPITAKLEPVPYDQTYISNRENYYHYGRAPTLGESHTIEDYSESQSFKNVLFHDEIFYKAYLQSLDRISDKKFLDDFFRSIDEELNDNEAIIKIDKADYSFSKSRERLYKNQKYLHHLVSPKESIHAYVDGYDKNQNQLIIEFGNYSHFPIEVTSLYYNGEELQRFEHPILLQAHKNNSSIQHRKLTLSPPRGFEIKNKTLKKVEIRYNILGLNKAIISKLIPWNRTDDKLDLFPIKAQSTIRSFDFLRVNNVDSTITIKKGNWKINQNLIIPKDYLVKAQGGTSLSLENGTMILSYSPFEMRGSEEHPIKIYSSDSKGQGITFMEVEEESIFEWVIFDNLDRIAQKNWSLAGAVNFYKSPVQFRHCVFSNNRTGDDCINITHSKFTIQYSQFKNINADALDGDFCTGKIQHVSFINVGNDALDFSGSAITLENINMVNVQDKGISVGESSTLTGKAIYMDSVEIAVAAKDLSHAQLENLTISNGAIGISVFQKKVEYGPASVNINGLNLSNVELPYLVELNSKVIVNGETIATDTTSVKDVLYGNKYGKASK